MTMSDNGESPAADPRTDRSEFNGVSSVPDPDGRAVGVVRPEVGQCLCPIAN
jgi:hypothetical protein